MRETEITLDKILLPEQKGRLREMVKPFSQLIGYLEGEARKAERFPTKFTINGHRYLFDGNKAKENVQRLKDEFYRQTGLEIKYC